MPGATWNAALTLTAVRIAAIPAVMALLLAGGDDGRIAAAIVYLLAAVTDSADGWLARSRGQVTVAGAFLDPLADKLLVSAALVAMIELDLIAAWPVIIIIAREFAVTGLRLVAVSEGLIIPASRLGKAKTVSQNAAIMLLLIPGIPVDLENGVLIVAIVLTVLSGAYYFQMARRRLFARKSPARGMSGDP